MPGPPVYYQYTPSLAAAVIFCASFCITTVFHLYQMIPTRTWYWIPFVVGGVFETVGFGARAISANQTPDWTLGPFVVQMLGILLAPALFAASIYMELGRIILMVDGEHLAIIKKRWLTKFFVAGDVFSFLVQCMGKRRSPSVLLERGQRVGTEAN